MPDDFYLPRYSPVGVEARDVMPFDTATTYVTDGIRVGIQFRDGWVDWFMGPEGGALHAGSYRFRRGALPEGFPSGLDPRATIAAVWRRNAAAFTLAGSD